MTSPTPHARRLLTALAAVLSFGLLAAGCGTPASPAASPPASTATTAATRTVTDMEGRTVELPGTVTKVVTLGSVPVINSFLFALGKGDLIGNGLPDNFTRDDRWKFQYVFAPQIENLPVMQGDGSTPLVEEIVKAQPDVVLTMVPAHAEQLSKLGLTVIVLRWQNDEDVKQVVTMLGEALDVPDRAASYVTTFDTILAEVAAEVSGVPDADRVSALSLDPKGMGQPHAIAQWWIAKAGGTAVTAGNTVESLKFDAEQVVAWNPQVIFVNDAGSIATTKAEPKFAPVRAVVDGRIYAMPIGAHLWGNRTSEQPLSVAYAAAQMYPDRVSKEELTAWTKRFYTDAFHAALTDAQIADILTPK